MLGRLHDNSREILSDVKSNHRFEFSPKECGESPEVFFFEKKLTPIDQSYHTYRDCLEVHLGFVLQCSSALEKRFFPMRFPAFATGFLRLAEPKPSFSSVKPDRRDPGPSRRPHTILGLSGKTPIVFQPSWASFGRPVSSFFLQDPSQAVRFHHFRHPQVNQGPGQHGD
jgi:hypothetical protein